MARKKPVPTVMVASLQDADRVLEELAELERRANGLKNTMNEKIDAAKAEAAEEMLPVEARKNELEGALSAFALMNKTALFTDRKSVELSFGTMGYRLSTRIVTAARGITWDMVLGKIRDLGLNGLRIKEEVNKEALAAWDDATLEKVGAKRKVEDTFGYTLKQQEPGQTMAA